ncbi:hypothetical protein R3I94_005024 [Phoxinus phoxinus]
MSKVQGRPLHTPIMIMLNCPRHWRSNLRKPTRSSTIKQN